MPTFETECQRIEQAFKSGEPTPAVLGDIIRPELPEWPDLSVEIGTKIERKVSIPKLPMIHVLHRIVEIGPMASVLPKSSRFNISDRNCYPFDVIDYPVDTLHTTHVLKTIIEVEGVGQLRPITSIDPSALIKHGVLGLRWYVVKEYTDDDGKVTDFTEALQAILDADSLPQFASHGVKDILQSKVVMGADALSMHLDELLPTKA